MARKRSRNRPGTNAQFKQFKEENRAETLPQKRETSRSKELAEMDMTYAAFRLAAKGYDYEEIAEELGSTRASVQKMVNNAMRQANEEIEVLKLSFATLGMTRMENEVKRVNRLIDELYSVLDKPKGEEPVAVDIKGITDLQRTLMQLTRLEMDLLGWSAGNKAGGMQQQINIVTTLNRDSALYYEGLAHMQLEHEGTVMPQMASYVEDRTDVDPLDDILDGGLE